MGIRGCLLPVLAFVSVSQLQAQGPPASGAKTQSPPDPVLVHRPASKALHDLPDGKVYLDVVVNDQAGKPVAGLESNNFKLLDNERSAKVASFRAFDGSLARPEPPVEVIFVVDELNLPFSQVSYIKSQLLDFFRRNEARLEQPVSIFVLNEKGVQVQPKPSTDRNRLVGLLNQTEPHISSINPAMGADGAMERTQISVRELANIAENEARKPGRKLLIWLGPGWPMLQSKKFRVDERNRSLYFKATVELTNRLREGRIVLYTVSPILSVETGPVILYRQFLNGVQNEQQADVGNLGLKVLVTNTGGRVLGPDNDLVKQIDECIADANTFYRVSFDPPKPEHLDEFHSLRMQVDRPGLLVRTNSGYYNEPK